MKKTLIIAAMSSMLFVACSGEAKKEATTDTLTNDTTMSTVDTSATHADTTAVPVDSAAIDSATKAHGHKH